MIDHPDYTKNFDKWSIYRHIKVGGEEFVDEYLHKFSNREDNTDFIERKKITYPPSHGKAALVEIENSIFQRMVDIRRIGGPQSYQNAIQTNIDLRGNTMDGFIGRIVLSELIFLGKTGIYLENPIIPSDALKSETANLRPYVINYRAEEIHNWDYDENNNLVKLILEETVYKKNDLGLPIDTSRKYYLYELTPNLTKTEISREGKRLGESHSINLDVIPFEVLELNHSLLQDVAYYQIALLNLASSDMNYALKSNFPFYTEQYSPGADMFTRMSNIAEFDETVDETTVAANNNDNDVETGTVHGRKYAKGLDRPQFINPSPEPLRVSMEKQRDLKEEIRVLLNINIATLQTRRASAESKKEDSKTKEEGISRIGLELEFAENQIAKFWAKYVGSDEFAIIKYPKSYSLKSFEAANSEADKLIEKGERISSLKLKRAIAKEVVTLTMASRLTYDELVEIHDEIEDSNLPIADPDTLRADIEAGILDGKTASDARNYPQGTFEKASKEHAEKLARIQAAQGGPQTASGAEGNRDAKSEREAERNIDPNATRGEGKK